MGRESRVRHQQTSRSISALAPSAIVNIAERRSVREPLQQEGRKVGIFIAVPTLSGRTHFSVPLLFARCAASAPLPECPFRFTFHVEPQRRGIDYARNRIVRTFLHDSDDDWLLMIDEDQIVPENFWMLCTVKDADVVAGLSPVWVANMDRECMLRVNNYGVDDQHQCYNLPTPDGSVTQPYRVPIAGTGCIAVRRRVFAPRPKGLGDAPFFFTRFDDQRVRGGEDVNFSVECNRLGFVVAVHPQVWVDHLKEIPLGQIESYYRARKKMETEGRRPTETQMVSIG